MDFYRWLAARIVENACKEYITALRFIEKYEKRNRKRDQYEINQRRLIVADCESFFKSQWFRELSEMDGLKIMEECRKKAGNLH